MSFRNAGKPEILKKFRKLAAKWHPDRFSDPEEKKKAEKKFIDIAAAKEVLTDPGIFCICAVFFYMSNAQMSMMCFISCHILIFIIYVI